MIKYFLWNKKFQVQIYELSKQRVIYQKKEEEKTVTTAAVQVEPWDITVIPKSIILILWIMLRGVTGC